MFIIVAAFDSVASSVEVELIVLVVVVVVDVAVVDVDTAFILFCSS